MLPTSRVVSKTTDKPRSRANDPAIHHAIGYVYFKSERYNDALRQLRRAVELDSSAEGSRAASLRFYLGLTLRAHGRIEQAANAVASALAIDPRFPEAEEARQYLEAHRSTSLKG